MRDLGIKFIRWYFGNRGTNYTFGFRRSERSLFSHYRLWKFVAKIVSPRSGSPRHENRNVETAQDYGSLVVCGVSRDGKFDCRRLQFGRNVKIARTAARKYAWDLRAARKAGREKSFYFRVCEIEFFSATFSTHALAPSARQRTVSLRLVDFAILSAVKQCRRMNPRKRFMNFWARTKVRCSWQMETCQGTPSVVQYFVT